MVMCGSGSLAKPTKLPSKHDLASLPNTKARVPSENDVGTLAKSLTLSNKNEFESARVPRVPPTTELDDDVAL
jgi:hypothetical protein